MPRQIVLIPIFAALLAGGCARRNAEIERVNWQVMGTVAAVQTRGDGAAGLVGGFAETAKDVFKEVETLLNAHDGSSEISRIAALPDAQVVKFCTKEMHPCYAAAFALCEASGGALLMGKTAREGMTFALAGEKAT